VLYNQTKKLKDTQRTSILAEETQQQKKNEYSIYITQPAGINQGSECTNQCWLQRYTSELT